MSACTAACAPSAARPVPGTCRNSCSRPRQVRQRQRLGLRLGQRALREIDPAHGHPHRVAQHLPLQHPGPADLVRGARLRSRSHGPARRRRHDGGDESADLGPRRGRDRARRLPVLRFHPTDAEVEVPRRHHRHRLPADRDHQRRLFRPAAAAAVQEHRLPRRALLGALSALLDMDVEAVQQAIAAQFKGKEKLVPANFAALEKGRAWAQENLSCPIGLRLRRADAVGDRIFTDGNNAAAAWCGLWRGHGLRLVSHHALHLAGGSLREALREAAQGPRHRGQALRHRAGGGRACLDRHGDRRGLERGAVLHRDLGTRHLADAGVRGVGVFR